MVQSLGHIVVRRISVGGDGTLQICWLARLANNEGFTILDPIDKIVTPLESMVLY